MHDCLDGWMKGGWMKNGWMHGWIHEGGKDRRY